MAGGLDSFDWLKDRIKRPGVVVDLSQVQGLRGIKEQNGGLEIGAATTLTEITRHLTVRDKFGLLMEAAELVASPQIRNQGTIGGNRINNISRTNFVSNSSNVNRGGYGGTDRADAAAGPGAGQEGGRRGRLHYLELRRMIG